jgi:hypothetical protein
MKRICVYLLVFNVNGSSVLDQGLDDIGMAVERSKTNRRALPPAQGMRHGSRPERRIRQTGPLLQYRLLPQAAPAAHRHDHMQQPSAAAGGGAWCN